MMGRLVLSLVGALVLTACGPHGNSVARRPTSSTPPTADHSTRPMSERQLDCSAHILAHGPDPSDHVFLGAVALQFWPASGILHTISSDPKRGTPRLFAKTGLLVRVGTPSIITVHASAHRVARIGWRNGSITPVRRVEVPPCQQGGTSSWLVFPGGYWVDRPTCVRVTVRSRGRAESERVAVGAPCS